MFHIKEKKIIYLMNPKVASSSIQVSILGPDRVDGAWRDTFRSLYGPPRKLTDPIFCVTRNPYSRIISGYKDKILPRKGKIWNNFSRALKFDPDTPLDFESF